MIIRKYKHPVLFYILSTILSWTCWFFAGYISNITPGDNTLILVTGGLAFLGLIAPNIVALLLILPDQELRRDMLGRFFNFKGVKVKYWFAACFFYVICNFLKRRSKRFNITAHFFDFACFKEKSAADSILRTVFGFSCSAQSKGNPRLLNGPGNNKLGKVTVVFLCQGQ